MDLVSPSTTPISQGIKTMHPQSNSTSLSPQTHLPQNLHHFSSLTVSTSSTSGHANPEQPSGIQKSNIAPVTTSQPHPPPVQPVANLAARDYSVTQEQTISEKSQTNGTSEPLSAPSVYPIAAKEKSTPPATPTQSQTAQNLQPHKNVDAAAPLTENRSHKSPVVSTPPKSGSIDAVVAKITPPTIESKPVQESPKKILDGPAVLPSSPSEKDKSEEPAATPVKRAEPEPAKPLIPKQVSKPEVQTAKPEESPKPDQSKVEKIVPTPEKVAVKTPTTMETPKDDTTTNKKETPEPKTPTKSSSRKTKSAQDAERPVLISTPSTSSAAAKRQRVRTQHYQSPLPEVELVSKISTSTPKSGDDRLIVFYKNEFLAVRNAEGGFYLCQAIQNIYKSSSKIRIRWLSQTENREKGEIYTPDFYDLIDFDCILTNLSLSRAEKGKYLLPISEKTRTESILNRSLAVEKGEEVQSPSLTEEHPDGLDLSLYRVEDQLKKRKARKRPRRAPPSRSSAGAATKKNAEAAKVRKVEPSPGKTAARKAPTRRSAIVTKKNVTKEVVAGSAKSSKTTSKFNNNKAATKSSPMVDQKKAKVLARIGRKTTVVAKSAAAKNNSKNGKSGNKTPSSVQKTALPKANSSSSTAKTTTRSVRKSTRK
ncbi:nucleolar protein dao-5-like isoform X2 [Euwallacea fornicatus]|uniref:nucleolar protein dao-5-like isoform X2 n=1 Tax=Euwallacea fornicatus TaxID=995702 RepID=UPI00338FDD34